MILSGGGLQGKLARIAQKGILKNRTTYICEGDSTRRYNKCRRLERSFRLSYPLEIAFLNVGENWAQDISRGKWISPHRLRRNCRNPGRPRSS